jgi:hypothetical protein
MRGQLRATSAWVITLMIATLCAIVFGFSTLLVQLRPPEPVVLAPTLDQASSLRVLAVGRQGYGNKLSEEIAYAMEKAAAEHPTHAVFLLGDNFHPNGVDSVDDPQWTRKFEALYDGAHLRGTPFFAVVGNHDVDGNETAEVDYSRERKGSARWHMDNLFYTRDFGRVKDRVLVRVVFLDTIDLIKDPEQQLDFAARAFEMPGEPVWRVIAGHYPLRTVTHEEYQRRRAMTALMPRYQAMNVDLAVSANDYFQQILDRPGEPLSVSANGGSDLQKTDAKPENASQDVVLARPGFAVLSFDDGTLSVELRDSNGKVSAVRTRKR